MNNFSAQQTQAAVHQQAQQREFQQAAWQQRQAMGWAAMEVRGDRTPARANAGRTRPKRGRLRSLLSLVVVAMAAWGALLTAAALSQVTF